MTVKIPRVLIGGTGSGCGKTTVACAIMQALINRGKKLAAFKIGPDYIDPMFHTQVVGAPSSNLDGFMVSRNNVPVLLGENAKGADLAVIEGVMGFYDGQRNVSDANSTADIGRLTSTPAILVMSCKGMGLTAAAVLEGVLRFRPNTIEAVILNGINANMLYYYKEIIQARTGIKVLGCLPMVPEARIESRHLGLVTAGEIAHLKDKLKLLADAAEENIDLDAIIAMADKAQELAYSQPEKFQQFEGTRIAVARDEAFCFTYEDSLGMLRKMGAELEFFSPVRDEKIPEFVCGMILSGGYPELYAEKLSGNKKMLRSIKRAISGGLPTVAECGGFLYLHESLDGFPLAGVIPARARMTSTLGNFGYMTLTAKNDNILCKKGEEIPAHEFHYSSSDDPGEDFETIKPNGKTLRPCVHAGQSLYAGYPHLHFCGCPDAAGRFLSKCRAYGNEMRK